MRSKKEKMLQGVVFALCQLEVSWKHLFETLSTRMCVRQLLFKKCKLFKIDTLIERLVLYSAHWVGRFALIFFDAELEHFIVEVATSSNRNQ